MYRAITIVFSIAISGCAAVANLQKDKSGRNFIHTESGEPLVYGGSRFDLECLHFTAAGRGGGANNFELFCLIDLPFSIVVDTVCLPYVLYQSKDKSK